METFEVGLILDTSVADCYMMNLHGISQWVQVRFPLQLVIYF
jgi:hypothetical protein